MISFPVNPTVGQVYTFNGSTWRYTGTVWDLLPPIFLPGVTGPSGPQGLQGPQGASGVVNYSPVVNTQSGVSYTVLASDNGKILIFTSGVAVSLTVPGFDAGFTVMLVQQSTGQVTVSGSGTTIVNRQDHTKLAGRFAVATLVSLGGNVWVLAGDTAA